MNEPLPTVAIVSDNDKAGFVLINERDFDPSVHKRYDPNATPPTTPGLNDLKGIGPARAAKLAEAGVGSLEALASLVDDVAIATVASVTGLSKKETAALVDAAKALLAP